MAGVAETGGQAISSEDAVLCWVVGGGFKGSSAARLEPDLSGLQVLLAQFKGTGKYYAIKALKKQEVLSRDEIERCVGRLGSPGPGGYPAGCLGWLQLNAPGALKR